jgi:hypothetical protein
MGHHIIIRLSSYINIHTKSMSPTFMTFICVTETGPGLDWVDSKLIYDGVEISRIASIYDVLCKNIVELICDM